MPESALAGIVEALAADAGGVLALDGWAANQNNVAKQPITKTMTLRTNSGIRTKRANR